METVYTLMRCVKKAADHDCEKVGEEVRSLYSWSDEDKLINN